MPGSSGKEYTVSEIADTLDRKYEGDGDKIIKGAGTLESAGDSEISFFSGKKYLDQLGNTSAGAVILQERRSFEGTVIFSDDPYLDFARTLELFYERKPDYTGISSEAVVGENCQIPSRVAIHPGVIIGENTRIGEETVIKSGCHIGEEVTIGENCRLYSGVNIYDGCSIGNNVIIHSGTVIGSDGFGFAQTGEGHYKVPQVGSVVIEDDVELGANVCVDRGTLENTVVGKGTKVDNQVQIAHNVEVGPHSLLVAQSGISGSTKLGEGVVFAGQSGSVGHIEIGDNTKVSAKSAVTKDVPPDSRVSGFPAEDHKKWLKKQGIIRKLPELYKRIKELEKVIDE